MAKNNKMDWDALKLQYYKSEIMEVKPWYESIGKKWSGTTASRTKGWA